MEEFVINQKFLVFVTESRVNKDGLLELSCQLSSDEVVEVMEDMTDKLLEMSSTYKKLQSCREGDLCVAQFSEDEQWYRTRIVKIDNGTALVKFIDYDNFQEISTNELYQLPQNYHEMPAHGRTYLLNINGSPKDSAMLWTESMATVITDNFIYKEVEITVTNVERQQVECSAISNFLLEKSLISNKGMYPHNTYCSGTTINGYLAHCESAAEIYLQDATYEDTLNQLMDSMASHFAETSNVVQIKEVKPGTVCASVYSEDDLTYRAQIVSKLGSSCDVKFVDYGNHERKKLSDVFELPKQFLTLPFQAIPCTLFGFKKDKSSDTVQDEVMNFVGEDGILANVKVSDPKNGFLAVEIKKEDSSNLLQHLQSLGIAQKADRISNTVTKKETTTLPQKSETSSLPQKSETSTLSRQSDNTTKQSKPSMIKSKISIPSNELAVGCKDNMLVTEIGSNGVFHCMSMKRESELNKQLDELYDTCKNASTLCRLQDLQVRDICAAKYDADENWYRAETIKASHSSVSVRFLDYGNSAECTKICELPNKFCDFPAQGICCQLHNGSPSDCEKLSELYDKTVEITALSFKDNIYSVTAAHNGTTLGSEPLVKTVAPAQAMQTQQHLDYTTIKFKIGTSSDVVIRCVENFDSIHCNLLKNVPALNELKQEMLDIYSAALKSDTLLSKYNENGLCVVKCKETKQYYRGKIVKVVSTNEMEVYFVDVGSTSVMKKKYIHKITPELLQLPQQAVKISFGSSVRNDEIIKHLKVLLLNNQFKAHFKDYDSSSGIYKVVLKNTENVDIDRNYVKNSMEQSQVKRKYPIRYITTDDIPPPQIKIGSTYEVKFGFVEMVECIWVNIISQEPAWISMTDKMNEFYNNIPADELVPKDAFPGLVCAVLVSGNWLRGSVICSYGDEVELKYLDTGREITVNLNDIKCLVQQFSTIPAQAVSCSLYNIEPTQLRWSRETFKYLTAKLSNKTGFCEFVSDVVVVYEVNLCIGSSKKTVQAEMVARNMAKWSDDTMSNISTKLDSGSDKINTDTKQVVGLTKLLEPQRLYYKHNGIGLIGIEVLVEITEWKSPGHFFAIPRNVCESMQYFLPIQIYNDKSEPCDLDNAYPGMPCIHINNSSTCLRASIVKLRDDGTVRICLVDFGRHEAVPKSSLKKIKLEHVLALGPSTSPLAIRCSLRGAVMPTQKSWGTKSIQVFQNFVQSNKDIRCTFQGCVGDGVNHLYVVHLSSPCMDLMDELKSIKSEVRSAHFVGEVNAPLLAESYFVSKVLKLGMEDQYFVTHIERADLFYCQLAKNVPSFTEIMEKIQSFAASVKPGVTDVQKLLKKPLCLAQDIGNTWYRAHFVELTELTKGGRLAKVMLVDHGSVEFVTLSKIIDLPADSPFIQTPIQALPCCLDGYDNITNTAEQCSALIHQLKSVALTQTFTGLVTSCNNGKLCLDLSKNGQNLMDMIKSNLNIASKTNKRSGSRTPPIIQMPQKKYDNMPIDIKSIMDCDIFEFPDAVYCRPLFFTPRYEDCVNGVDNFFTTRRESDLKVAYPKLDDPVAAVHSTAKKWSRAVIVEIHKTKEGTKLLLEFVDEGGRELFHIDKVKNLTAAMMNWHVCCVKISQSNLEPRAKLRFLSFDNSVWRVEVLEGKKKPSITPDVTKLESKPQAVIPCVQEVATKLEKTMPVVKKVPEKQCLPEKKASLPGIVVNGKIELGEGKIDVYISHAFDDDKAFYAQLVENENLLADMMEELKNLQLESFDNITMGDFCLAPFQDDGYLYRGKVTAVDKKSCNVFYIDYGNSDTVVKTHVNKLPQKYSTVSQQATRCVIQTQDSIDDVYKVLEPLELENVCVEVVGKTDDSDIVNLYKFDEGNHVMVFKSETSKPTNLSAPDMVDTFVVPGLQTGAKIVVSYIESLHNFWVQVLDNETELENINGTVVEECGNNAQVPDLFENGKLVCALSSEYGDWYRAMVKEHMKSDKSCRVTFYDFGNTETVQLDNIREMSDKLKAYKPMAANCKLSGLKFDEQSLSSEASEELFEYMQENEFNIEICETVDEYPKSYLVELKSEDEKTINDWYVSKFGQLPLQKESKDIKLVSDNKEDEEPALDIKETVQIDQPKPGVEDEHEAEGIKPVKDNEIEKDSPVSVKEDMPPSVEPKSFHNVKIIPDMKEVVKVLKTELTGNDKPVELSLSLVNYHGDDFQISEEEQSVKLKVNHPYIAYSSSAKKWLRALCLDINASVAVMKFIDLSFVESCPVSKVVEMNSDILQNPIAVVQCDINGTQDDNELALKLFQYFSGSRTEFVAHFLKPIPNSEKWLVEMHSIGPAFTRNTMLEVPITEDELSPGVPDIILTSNSGKSAYFFNTSGLEHPQNEKSEDVQDDMTIIKDIMSGLYQKISEVMKKPDTDAELLIVKELVQDLVIRVSDGTEKLLYTNSNKENIPYELMVRNAVADNPSLIQDDVFEVTNFTNGCTPVSGKISTSSEEPEELVQIKPAQTTKFDIYHQSVDENENIEGKSAVDFIKMEQGNENALKQIADCIGNWDDIEARKLVKDVIKTSIAEMSRGEPETTIVQNAAFVKPIKPFVNSNTVKVEDSINPQEPPVNVTFGLDNTVDENFYAKEQMALNDILAKEPSNENHSDNPKLNPDQSVGVIVVEEKGDYNIEKDSLDDNPSAAFPMNVDDCTTDKLSEEEVVCKQSVINDVDSSTNGEGSKLDTTPVQEVNENEPTSENTDGALKESDDKEVQLAENEEQVAASSEVIEIVIEEDSLDENTSACLLSSVDSNTNQVKETEQVKDEDDKIITENNAAGNEMPMIDEPETNTCDDNAVLKAPSAQNDETGVQDVVYIPASDDNSGLENVETEVYEVVCEVTEEVSSKVSGEDNAESNNTIGEKYLISEVDSLDACEDNKTTEISDLNETDECIRIGNSGDGSCCVAVSKTKREKIIESRDEQLPLRKIEPGDRLLLDFSHCSSADRLHFHFNESAPETKKLNELLKQYECQPKSVIPQEEVKPGLLCFVLCDFDMSWHRAEVLSRPNDENANVLLLDSCIQLPNPISVSQIHALPNDLAEYLATAITCKVHGLNETNEADEEQKTKILKDACFGNTLTGIVISINVQDNRKVFELKIQRDEDLKYVHDIYNEKIE